MRATSTVLRMPWDSFGTTEQVVQAIRTMAEPPAEQGWERGQELLALCVPHARSPPSRRRRSDCLTRPRSSAS